MTDISIATVILIGGIFYLLGMLPFAFAISFIEEDYMDIGLFLAVWPIYPLILIGRLYLKILWYLIDLGEKIRNSRKGVDQ